MRLIILFFALSNAVFCLGQDSFSDCSTAFKVCNTETIVFDYLPNFGLDSNELGRASCYGKDFPETNSAWLTWTIKNPGSLEFSIIPIGGGDDLDFVLFKGSDPTSICAINEEIRCMSSGKNLGEESGGFDCLGASGIKIGAGDFEEWQGCSEGDDNFLEGLYVNQGDVFLLFVNNISSNNGFVLEFFGNAEFEEDGCQSTSSVFNGFSDQIRIGNLYPNPVLSELFIDINSNENYDASIQVFNVSGILVRSFPYHLVQGKQSISVDISNQNQGVFFLKIDIGEAYYIAPFRKL